MALPRRLHPLERFPGDEYQRNEGFRKLVSEAVLRSGAFWAALGLGLLIKHTWSYVDDINNIGPHRYWATFEEHRLSEAYAKQVGLISLGAAAVIFAFLCILAAPATVRRLYGRRLMQSAPWLVGFEGTLPAAQLEKIIVGNCDGGLSYEPSTTAFFERIGLESSWIIEPNKNVRSPLPMGRRVFILLDTGALTVSVFSAVRPPFVALIAGRESGMLRPALCYYERLKNCLYKESAMRIDSITLNQAKTPSWIKLNLGNDFDE